METIHTKGPSYSTAVYVLYARSAEQLKTKYSVCCWRISLWYQMCLDKIVNSHGPHPDLSPVS